jgi:hypothetical protein
VTRALAKVEPDVLADHTLRIAAYIQRVAHPSHPGYANRSRELAIAGAA